jgi:hypothetical protein
MFSLSLSLPSLERRKKSKNDGEKNLFSRSPVKFKTWNRQKEEDERERKERLKEKLVE